MNAQGLSFWTQILLGLFGGFLSGGLIVGWIEYKRYQREKKLWDKEDKKIELMLLSMKSYVQRWHTDYQTDQEKIRLFESGLVGKIRLWMFFVKYEISNLTESDVLVHNVTLEFQQPQLTSPKNQNNKYFLGYKPQIIKSYNLLSKDLIKQEDYPILIPAHSKTGFVFIGTFEYDYPNIVESVPSSCFLRVIADNNQLFESPVQFNEAGSIPLEIATNLNDNEFDWVLYMEKHGIDWGYG